MADRKTVQSHMAEKKNTRGIIESGGSTPLRALSVLLEKMRDSKNFDKKSDAYKKALEAFEEARAAQKSSRKTVKMYMKDSGS